VKPEQLPAIITWALLQRLSVVLAFATFAASMTLIAIAVSFRVID
jgi:hypothetical protein